MGNIFPGEISGYLQVKVIKHSFILWIKKAFVGTKDEWDRSDSGCLWKHFRQGDRLEEDQRESEVKQGGRHTV